MKNKLPSLTNQVPPDHRVDCVMKGMGGQEYKLTRARAESILAVLQSDNTPKFIMFTHEEGTTLINASSIASLDIIDLGRNIQSIRDHLKEYA